jgi:hypothetical protein
MVPGLLQTEGYIRAVVKAARPVLPADDIERAVALRMSRQEILAHEHAPPTNHVREPRFWFIIDESVLHRIVGSPQTMSEQRNHLVSVAQQPNVTILVTKKFGSVVYLEDVQSARYGKGVDEVGRYVLIFDHLRAAALDEEASINLIKG